MVDSTDSEIAGTDLDVWERTSVGLTGSGETRVISVDSGVTGKVSET